MYPFYTTQDVEFRLLRDNFLNEKEYKKIMLEMFKIKKFNYKKIIKKIFLTKSQIKKLSDSGNIVGLHSHSHTFNFDNLPLRIQENDYKKNNRILKSIINLKINSACYPGGKLNSHSIKILKKLKIQCSFIDNFKKNRLHTKKNNYLLVPREDSSNIIKLI